VIQSRVCAEYLFDVAKDVSMIRLTILTLILAAPTFAGTEGEEDKLIVNRLSASDFEVVETQDMSPRAFWCGAASYIERRQNMDATTRIILKSPRGASVSAPGRKAVGFTTDPSGIQQISNPLSVDVTRRGLTLLSYQARGFCRDAFTRATK
jgi:hypothetical protein